MRDVPRLTLAYIKKRPDSAARVLSAMAPADCAAFVTQIPTRYAVSVVTRLNPIFAARLVHELAPESAGALIREMAFGDASAIIRQLAAGDRAQLLTHLPTHLKRRLDRALAFAAGTVGAHMTTAVMAVTAADTVASALRIIRQANDDQLETLLVLGERRQLIGAVSSATLLRHPPQTALGDICDRACPTVAERARLGSVENLEAWHDYSQLPVATRRGEVVGMLPRSAFRRAGSFAGADGISGGQSLAGSLVVLLGATASGLMDLFSTPPAGRIDRGERHER